MKRLFAICILLAMLAASALWPPIAGATMADASAVTYALISDDTVLFSDSENGERSAVTTLPANYFVAVRGEADADGFLPVTYLDLVGFVRADSVAIVDFEPKYKYCTAAALTLFNDGFGVNLRALPDHTADNVTCTLAPAAGMFFYGTVHGSEQVAALGDLWYYVRANVAGKDVRGYVYSLYVSDPAIPDNIVEPVVAPPDDPPSLTPDDDPATGDADDRVSALPPAREAIVVVALCLPMAVIAFLLFRRPPGAYRDSTAARDSRSRRSSDEKRRDLVRRIRLDSENRSAPRSDPPFDDGYNDES